MKPFNLKKKSSETLNIYRDEEGRYTFSYSEKDDEIIIESIEIPNIFGKDLMTVIGIISDLNLELEFLYKNVYER